MENVSIVKSELLNELIFKIENLERMVTSTLNDLKAKTKPYLTGPELMELTGFGETWLKSNKHKVGCSVVGGKLRFKRKDVEEFMEQNYFKLPKNKQ